MSCKKCELEETIKVFLNVDNLRVMYYIVSEDNTTFEAIAKELTEISAPTIRLILLNLMDKGLVDRDERKIYKYNLTKTGTGMLYNFHMNYCEKVK